MSLRINNEAPNFTAEGDGWAILFSHPKDFTPVCTTELGYMAGLQPEFEKRNCKIIGLSVDPVTDHTEWSRDIEETQGHALNYPLIGDTDLKVAKLYDMLPAEVGETSEGREVLRVLDSIQLTAKHKVATPVNWKNGEDVIIVPAVSDDEAKEKYPGGWEAPKPYLRIVPQPD
jgi:alkyl hydroperoxide reductase subunit AhpC